MKTVICKECANGCNLKIDQQNDGLLKVSGNQCDKGIAYSRAYIKKFEGPGAPLPRILAAREPPRYSDKVLADILRLWGLVFQKKHPAIMIQGSPERTVFRMVVEDEKGQPYVLEQIARRDLEKKKKIAQTLDFLSQKELARVQPFLAGSGGQVILEHDQELWQLRVYTPGEPLDRERYIFDRWRGLVLAEFLQDLRTAAKTLLPGAPADIFSIKKYIYTLVAQIQRHQPDIAEELAPVLDFLEDRFMKVHDELPVAFCHGDYHPLNIIWSEADITAVIDWEFHGFKPELYDLSNLIGCIGMEHPSALQGDLVKIFIGCLREAKIIDEKSWRFLLEFVVALRFAWLSEWLRKSDTEMINLELVYMKLLIDNNDSLLHDWGLHPSVY